MLKPEPPAYKTCAQPVEFFFGPLGKGLKVTGNKSHTPVLVLAASTSARIQGDLCFVNKVLENEPGKN